ncbi:MAG: hypothetical protein IRZ28_22890 [Steroidobacteraceae bacterium]|nr:hypothetical protein [Steroidobacteraceae bacterium]
MASEPLPDPWSERSLAPTAPVEEPSGAALSAAELAECTCPDFCERDHGNE